jgi:hypothetical protein
MAELRAERDREYRALLDAQKEQRGELIDRQDRGLSSPQLLDKAYPPQDRQLEAESEEARIAAMLDRFGIRRGRAPEAEQEQQNQDRGRETGARTPYSGRAGAPPLSPSRDLASGLAGGFLAIVGGLSESMTGGHTKSDKPSQDVIDALDRFGIRRGRAPPLDNEPEQARRGRRSARPGTPGKPSANWIDHGADGRAQAPAPD